jgi:NhaA family Na+:H+ antiporter
VSESRAPQAAQRLLAFINHEATAGFILALAAAAALVAYNTGPRSFYDELLTAVVSVSINDLAFAKPLLHWVNDGLMAVFFFLVGIEIKREVLEGSLSSRDQIVLPAVAAAGGMAVPAFIYCLVSSGHPELLKGWAIPAATDIAFALGALSLAGSRVPPALKVFLLTLATLDDLGAIAIIAAFYTSSLSVVSLALAGMAFLVLALLNQLHVSRLAPYLLVGIAMWVFVLESGIHATLAGVALAMMIPLNRSDGEPFLHAIEERLHPYVTFAILPLFAFANAGVPLDGFTPGTLFEPLPLAIAAGLAIGKPAGILGAVFLASRLRWAQLPENTEWRDMAGVGCLAGIGFTMSLFIGMLAFEDAAHAAAVRFGVIAGSLVSIALGLAILLLPRPETRAGLRRSADRS